MEIVDITNPTIILAENQPEYQNLPVLCEAVGDSQSMTSLWFPTNEELKALVDGGCVRLSVMGFSHPPVLVGVQDTDGQVVGTPSAKRADINATAAEELNE